MQNIYIYTVCPYTVCIGHKEGLRTELFGYCMRLSIRTGSVSLICINTFHNARQTHFNNLLIAENTPPQKKINKTTTKNSQFGTNVKSKTSMP